MLAVPMKKIEYTRLGSITTKECGDIDTLLTSIFPSYSNSSKDNWSTRTVEGIDFALTSDPYDFKPLAIKMSFRDQKYRTVWRKVLIQNGFIDETKVKEKHVELVALKKQDATIREMRVSAEQDRSAYLETVREECKPFESKYAYVYNITCPYLQNLGIDVRGLNKDQLKQLMELLKSFESSPV